MKERTEAFNIGSVKRHVLRKMALRSNVTVGARFHVGPRTTIWAPQSLSIGDDVYVGKNVTIEVDGRIGSGSLIANSVGIVGRHDHEMHQLGSAVRRSRWVGDFPDSMSQPVDIGSDVWIGYGSIILSGVTIGDHAIIAAGSVVIEDIRPNTIVGGYPARQLKCRLDAEELREHRRLLGLPEVYSWEVEEQA